MSPNLILVSNRLPVSVKKVDGKLEFFPSVGGLATGMASYTQSGRNTWIGWPGIPSDDLSDDDKQQITDELETHNCYPVFLTKKQIDAYYNGYSNSILWPLFHDVPLSEAAKEQRTQFWQAYQQTNRHFARAVLKLSQPGSTIWVHDYQLMLLPSLLRAERPADKIGFFLHIPFPAAANFFKIPEAQELVAGLLGADLVGFHTESYVHNFLDATSNLDVGIVTQKEIVVGKRVIRVADFPIGIDYSKYARAVKLLAVQGELAKFRIKYYGKKVILTVDRLDPAKGLVERAEAYQSLLRDNPALHGKVVMVMLVVPSRTDIAEYQQLKERLDKLVNQINAEFGTRQWQPLEYLYQSMPFEQLSALYRRTDVAFIAPLRDGMNLVAKEYLASQVQRGGVLVLSQTAGAAHELKHAVMVNPKKPNSLVQGLKRAMDISKPQWKRRATKMQRRIKTFTIHTWAGNFIDTLQTPLSMLPVKTWTLTPKRQAEIVTAFRTAKRRLLLLDYDGALVPLARRPEDAIPKKSTKNLLTKLAQLPHTEVVIISGRAKSNLAEWFGHLPISLAAEHGTFYRMAHETEWHRASNARYAWKEKIIPVLEKYAAKTPGAFVENKESALVWHYRTAGAYAAQKSLVALRRSLAPLVEKYGLRAHNGKKIVEVRATGIDKGTAAKRWLASEPDFVLATGDDYTDEDTFMSVPEHAFTIKVGRGRTTARLRTYTVDECLQLLTTLSKETTA